MAHRTPEKEKEYNRRNYLKHRDKRLAKVRAYAQSHKVEIQARGRRWRLANKAIIVERRKSYYSAHAEEIRARSRAYHKNNKDQRREYRRAYRARCPENRIKWYAKNKKRLNAARRAYYASHREKISQECRKWREKHAEHCKQKSSVYRAAHREQMREYLKKYSRLHPEKCKRNTEVRRAREKNASIGDPRLITEWEKRWKTKVTLRCYWCFKPTPVAECHKDHIIPLSKGGAHTVENLCVSCSHCNSSKKASTLSEWNARLENPVLL